MRPYPPEVLAYMDHLMGHNPEKLRQRGDRPTIDTDNVPLLPAASAPVAAIPALFLSVGLGTELDAVGGWQPPAFIRRGLKEECISTL